MFFSDAWWSSTFIINAFWSICELPDYSIENEHSNSCLKCWRSQFLLACRNIWHWTNLDIFGLSRCKLGGDPHLWACIREGPNYSLPPISSQWLECLQFSLNMLELDSMNVTVRNLIRVPTLGAVPAKCCTHQAFSKGDRQLRGISWSAYLWRLLNECHVGPGLCFQPAEC